ncbi:hypothetical protein V8B97DRAFT_1877298, partial [Scleroderma yunnanense]
DVRHYLKLEQTQKEILAGNYNVDTYSSTPPLNFSFFVDDEAIDTEVNFPKKTRKCICPLAIYFQNSW